MRRNRQPVIYQVIVRCLIACVLIATVPSSSQAGPLHNMLGKGIDKFAAAVKKVKAKVEPLKPKGTLKKAVKNKIQSKRPRKDPCATGCGTRNWHPQYGKLRR